MQIVIKNEKKRTSIEVSHENVDYWINTDEKYDANGNQYISSSIIDTIGFPNPGLDKNILIRELRQNGIIVDDE